MDKLMPDYQITALESTDVWVECKQCHYHMLKLSEYEIDDIGEAPAVDADAREVGRWGIESFLMGLVSQFVLGTISKAIRKHRLAKLKADILPSFPRSLVCVQCLSVVRRK